MPKPQSVLFGSGLQAVCGTSNYPAGKALFLGQPPSSLSTPAPPDFPSISLATFSQLHLKVSTSSAHTKIVSLAVAPLQFPAPLPLPTSCSLKPQALCLQPDYLSQNSKGTSLSPHRLSQTPGDLCFLPLCPYPSCPPSLHPFPVPLTLPSDDCLSGSES